MEGNLFLMHIAELQVNYAVHLLGNRYVSVFFLLTFSFY